MVALKHRSTLSQYSLSVFISEVQLDEIEQPFFYFPLNSPTHSIIEFFTRSPGYAMKEQSTQTSESIKAKQRHKQRGNFSSLALIVKHSCGIFTALFSHVNTTSEREDWELCWNSTSTYHRSPGRISLPSGRLSVRGRSGRRKSKKKKRLPLLC